MNLTLSPTYALLVIFVWRGTIVFFAQSCFFIALKGKPSDLQLASSKSLESNHHVALTSPSLGHGLPFCVYLL